MASQPVSVATAGASSGGAGAGGGGYVIQGSYVLGGGGAAAASGGGQSYASPNSRAPPATVSSHGQSGTPLVTVPPVLKTSWRERSSPSGAVAVR